MVKKIILATVLMVSVFTLISCRSDKQVSDSNSNQSSVTDNTSSEDSDSKKEDKVEDKNQTEENDKNKNENEQNTQTNEKDTNNKIKLSIYSIDENSLEPNEVGSVSLDANLNLNDKLAQFSNSISKTNFDGLTIQVKSIDTIDGKKVATINLADSGNNTWVQRFQGSTGGQVTANTLIENYLQSNNKSNFEWIDGVKFLYNNETIEYDHVAELSEIHYR